MKNKLPPLAKIVLILLGLPLIKNKPPPLAKIVLILLGISYLTRLNIVTA